MRFPKYRVILGLLLLALVALHVWNHVRLDAGGLSAGSAYVFTGLADCDDNGVLDALDIADGAADENGNGVPDACETAPCAADLSGDGAVGGADLAFLLGEWGACADPENCPADLTGDGNVDGADLASLLGLWGDCP